MLLYILLALVVVIAIILIAASTKPNTVHYERSVVINAPPERIMPHIVDFHSWKPWSPWEKMDPEMKREYSGAASGVGAKYNWSGNKKVGIGSMQITEVAPDRVKIDMHFIKPWEAQCIAHFRTASEGNGTRLTWTMDGPNLFMGKVFSLFVNMDKMIGKDFETGLAGIKAQAERS